MKRIYLVINEQLDYVVDYCSSRKAADQCVAYYVDKVSHGRYSYRIEEKLLIPSNFYTNI